MTGQNYYITTALPSLGELGSAPPLKLGELLEHVRESPGPTALMTALLLGDDLMQREAVLAREIERAEPTVLSRAQLSDEQPLPEYLAGAEETTRLAADVIWEAYFRHAAGVAARRSSRFLAAWVTFEVSLRNAVAAARAKQLDLEPGDYLVAADLASEQEDLGAVVSEWAAAADPLAGTKVLDRARWTWLTAHEAWFTFADDELAAYAAKLVLLERWCAMSGRPQTGTDRPDAADESMRNQT